MLFNIRYHIIAFSLGFALDLIIGDPAMLPHPIRWMGALIKGLETYFLGDGMSRSAAKAPARKRIEGAITAILVCLISGGSAFLATFIAYRLSMLAGCLLESIITCYMLAAKSLRTESMKVYDRLKKGTLEEARAALSMIVGRDTRALDKAGVTKAAVETVAENASDGVVAPLIYLALLGPVGGVTYKAVNTLDSMIGYKNERFIDFGRFAAKLDDIVNFIPSRLSAVLMIIACSFMGRDYSAADALRIFKRDRFKHASPNSAQTESAMAGALGVRLAGDASYFGKIVKKPFIGDDRRGIETEDIRRANRLMYASAFAAFGLCLAMLCLAAHLIKL